MSWVVYKEERSCFSTSLVAITDGDTAQARIFTSYDEAITLANRLNGMRERLYSTLRVRYVVKELGMDEDTVMLGNRRVLR